MKSNTMDNVVALLPWDRTVRRAATRARLVDLLEKKNADEVLSAMTPLEVYTVIKETGLEDSVPVLALLDAEQVRALFDLDVWRRDCVDLSDVLVWLGAFKEAGGESLGRVLASLDTELVALLMRRRLHIAHKAAEGDEGIDERPEWIAHPSPAIEPLIETKDRRFVVAARVFDETDDEGTRPIDEEERKAILELVEELYRDESGSSASHLLALAASDLSSTLEEDALRFRRARLEDLGFPPMDRALEIYGPLKIDERMRIEAPMSVEAPMRIEAPIVGDGSAGTDREGVPQRLAVGTTLEMTVVHTSGLREGAFFEVLASIESSEMLRRIEAELVALANAALVVDQADPSDMARVREVLAQVRGCLDLAVTYGAPPTDPIGHARERVRSTSLRDLFRIGYTLTLERGGRARRLGGLERWLLDDERAVLHALGRRRPMFPRSLESKDPQGRVRTTAAHARLGAESPMRREAGTQAWSISKEQVPRRNSMSDEETVRPFESIRDLELVDLALEDLEGLDQAARRLGLADHAEALPAHVLPPAPERTFEVILTTGAVRTLLGQGFEVRGLSSHELGTVRERLLDRSAFFGLVEEVLEAGGLAGPLSSLGPSSRRAVGTRMARGLARLAESLTGGLTGGISGSLTGAPAGSFADGLAEGSRGRPLDIRYVDGVLTDPSKDAGLRSAADDDPEAGSRRT